VGFTNFVESNVGSLLSESKGIGYEVGSLLFLVLFFNKLGRKRFGLGVLLLYE
jgi:hypothetical protein